MAELKTTRNARSVSAFLNAIDEPQKRADAKLIARMMREATGSDASVRRMKGKYGAS